MKDAAKPALPFLADDAEGIVLGLARVNHNRQVALEREPNLDAKHVVLHVARREVVVVIETDLADGASGRQRVKPSSHGVSGRLRIRLEDLGVMRMDADCESTFGPGCEHGPRA